MVVLVESDGVAIFSGLAGGHSLALVIIHVNRRVVTPKSNTERGRLLDDLAAGDSKKNCVLGRPARAQGPKIKIPQD